MLQPFIRGREGHQITKRPSKRKRGRPPRVDNDQLNLPWGSVPPLVRDLRTINHHATGMNRHAWKQIRELLIAIILCGRRDGCHASVDALVRVANQNAHPGEPVIGSKATFHRVLKKAKYLRLLKIERISSKKGNAPSYREVIPGRVAELVATTRKLASEKRLDTEKNARCETHLRPTCNSLETHLPFTTAISTSKTSLSQRSTVDQKKAWSSEQIESVRREANRVVAKIGRTKCRQDRDLLCKACYLVYVSRMFPMHWLENAVEGVIRRSDGLPDTPFAYFQNLLYGEGNEHKPCVCRELARLVVPEELLQSRTLQPSENLPKRLCIAEEL